ncbi:MAG: YjjG family noncanonical pyrimidine nucleotidase [Flavobacteriales bacterium]
MKYKHLFFDLDGTLWDLFKNTEIALIQLLDPLEQRGFRIENFEQFYRRYHIHNDRVWSLYRAGKMDKHILRTERFKMAFNDINLHVPDETIDWLANSFLDICPKLPHLLPGTLDMLEALKDHYTMHIITNGFQEVQGFKMKAGRLDGYFSEIINSEDAGVKKPDPGIFEYALNRAGAKPEESLMIGDDWDADILGSRDFGMDQAYITSSELRMAEMKGKEKTETRHNYKPTFVVNHLSELQAILKQ